ncbi:MAG: hypothetical protein KDD94_13415 [Calditrichaeota bacterium]|nr:hypothetical protein [Calditrichota bacterium]
MNIETAITGYIQSLQMMDYPAELVNRRHFTFQRFLNAYDDFDSSSLRNFIEDNSFLSREYFILLKLDIFCLLRYLEQQGLIGTEVFRELEL